jgi:hypothetical protein
MALAERVSGSGAEGTTPGLYLQRMVCMQALPLKKFKPVKLALPDAIGSCVEAAYDTLL